MALTSLTRKAKVTYGDFSIGEGTENSYLLDGPVLLKMTSFDAVVTFKVVVLGAPHSTFKTNIDTLNTKFSKLNKKIKIESYGVTDYEFDPSQKTGYDAVVDWEETGEAKGPFSTVLRVVMSVKRNSSADSDADAYVLRSATLETDSNGFKRLTITGTFLATASTGAWDNYLANIGALVTAIKNKISNGTKWEELPSIASSEDPVNKDDKVNFTKIFEQLTIKETDEASASTLDDPNLSEIKISIAPTTSFPGDYQAGAKIKPPIAISATIEGKYVITGTKELKEVWRNTLRPYLITKTKEQVEIGSFSVLSASLNYDPRKKYISGTLQCAGIPADATFVSYRIKIDVRGNHGFELTPMWGGNEFDYRVDPFHAMLTRVTTETFRRHKAGIVGVTMDSPQFAKVGKTRQRIGKNFHGWLETDYGIEEEPVTYGDPIKPGEHYTMIDEVRTKTEVWIGTSGTGGSVIVGKTSGSQETPRQSVRSF